MAPREAKTVAVVSSGDGGKKREMKRGEERRRIMTVERSNRTRVNRELHLSESRNFAAASFSHAVIPYRPSLPPPGREEDGVISQFCLTLIGLKAHSLDPRPSVRPSVFCCCSFARSIHRWATR